jgi:hypothetical protein
MGKDTARRDFLIKTNELARDTNGEKSLEIISNIKNNRRDSWQSKPDGKKYGEMSEMRSIIGMPTDPEFQEFSKNILSWNSKHTDKLDPMFSGKGETEKSKNMIYQRRSVWDRPPNFKPKKQKRFQAEAESP